MNASGEQGSTIFSGGREEGMTHRQKLILARVAGVGLNVVEDVLRERAMTAEDEWILV